MNEFSDWIKSRKELLLLEREAECSQLKDIIDTCSTQECQEKGITVLNLYIEDVRTSLFGRSTIVFSKYNKDPIPTHSLKVGDEVCFYSQKVQAVKDVEIEKMNGIVTKAGSVALEIVFDGEMIELAEPIRIDLRVNETTHNKMMEALSDLSTINQESKLVNLLFHQFHADQKVITELLGAPLYYPTPNAAAAYKQLQDTTTSGTGIALCKTPQQASLNTSQIDAIQYALQAPHLALIHGPPGTGKTSTVAELIVQAVNLRKQKILVACPSNVAVDNVLERIHSYPENIRPSMVRLGHPARISASIQSYCLESLIASADGTEIVQDVRQELEQLRKSIGREKDKTQKKLQRGEMKVLQKEIRAREERVLKDVIKTRDVIFCTLVGASSKLLREMEFDMVIIDEAAQALEVACWIPLLKGNKCVLAGDHCQLPPTVKSPEAEKAGLGSTLFERIMHNPSFHDVSKLLNTQYRMNHLICEWASHAMYQDKLLSADSVRDRTLQDISVVSESGSVAAGEELISVSSVMMLIDTAGCYMEEQLSDTKVSHRNLAEVDLVYKHVTYLIQTLHIKQQDIGIVTPYNGQLEALREKIRDEFPLIDIKTVDGFQGGEKEVIILSLVRSNASRTVGFLADKRRINVAVTRAKRHVAIICDTDTCSADSFLRGLFEYVSEHGEHRSAMEYLDDVPSAGGVSDPNPLPIVPVPSSSSINTVASATPPPAPAEVLLSLRDRVLPMEEVLDVVMALFKDPLQVQPLDAEYDTSVLIQGTCKFMLTVIKGNKQPTRKPRQMKWLASMNDRLYTIHLIPVPTPPSPAAGVDAAPALNPPVLQFPPEFTSYYRHYIHSKSEELGLYHQSVLLPGADAAGVVVGKYIEISRSAFIPPPVPVPVPVPVPGAPISDRSGVNIPQIAAAAVGDSHPPAGGASSMPAAAVTAARNRYQALATPAAKATVTTTASNKAASTSSGGGGQRLGSSVADPSPGARKKGAAAVLVHDGRLHTSLLDKLEGVTVAAASIPASTGKGKTSKPPPTGTSSSNIKDMKNMSEEEVLDMLISQNKALEDERKYRVACPTAMPNPEKERNKHALHSKLEASRLDRLQQGITSSESGTGKKVLKKPTPNFGGGVLGKK